jgi:thymidine kinase
MTTNVQKRVPEFILYTGPMWSGKSSALLAAIDRYRHQGRLVEVFKAALDDRYSTVDIVTHTGWRVEARPVSTGADLLRHVIDIPGRPDVVALDEVFMVAGAAEALVELYRNGVTVAASSLDLSAQGKPFREVEALMPWATRIEKLAAVCEVCKVDARYTWKKGGGASEIEVGGAQLYSPRCATHHPIVNLQGLDT